MKSYRFWGSVFVIVLLLVWAVILSTNQQPEEGSEVGEENTEFVQ